GASDDCTTVNCSSTFTVPAQPALTVSCPDPVTIPACTSQQDIDAAFAAWLLEFSYTGGCGVTATDLSGYVAPDACVGGLVSIIYTAMGDCMQSASCTTTFFVPANTGPVIGQCPVMRVIE